MNYQQTLDYLFAQLPMFSRIGAAAYKADLHNIIGLCKALDEPQKKITTIHIAGTNGKGSTSHMLAAILQQAGYKTGLYTSPHLKDFRERIKINGEMIDENDVVLFVQRIKEFIQTIQPSFFELTAAMAFDYFAQQQVDIAIIETGLGGRLDSTNIITPLLSVITNIGYDHMNLLGNTLEQIASEKAGIIKPNVPVVIGEYLPVTKNIFTIKANELNAPIFFAQEEYNVSAIRYEKQLLCCNVTHNAGQTTTSFELGLNGVYQIKNLCTVLCATSILKNRGFTINDVVQKEALKNVKKLTELHGRWEIIREYPTIILDVGHNEGGMKAILDSLNLFYPGKSKSDKHSWHFVVGMVNDKDIDKVLSLLPKNAHYYFTNAHIPRALPHAQLKEKADGFGLHGESYDTVNEAMHIALQHASDDDVIIVCGSVFVVGEVETKLFQNR